MRLKDKVAVITGATRGIGRALGMAFAAEGARVVINGRSAASVGQALREFEAAGFPASGLTADVADLDQMRRLAGHAIETFGGLDIWINNAGVSGPYGPTIDVDPGVIEQIFHTNILGVYYGSRAALQHFVQKDRGKLINMLGRGARSPTPYQNAYASSKAWMRSFTRALATETKGSGVGVFAYSPGMVLTEMLSDVRVIQGHERRLDRFATILRMWARQPEKVTEKAVWLASSATDGKTGLEIYNMSALDMAAGAAREGLRALLGKEPPPLDLTITSIPPSR